VGSKNLVSVVNVAYSDWAIGQKLFAHHARKFPFVGDCNHSSNALGFSGPLNILPGISFKVCTHSVNKHQLHVAAWV
jgi:hypothetical protein